MSVLNFISLLTLIRILLFPCLKLFLPLVTGIEFLDFRHKESGEGINDGLRQFELVWILTLFLAGHGVLPQQQNLSGSIQPIPHSFLAMHSCQRVFPYTDGVQIISKLEKFLIELRTCRIHYSDFRRSVTGFLEVGVRNRFIVFWVDTVGFSTTLLFDGYKICILQLPQRVHRFLTATVQ